jgi:hypothetical protein
MQGLTHSNVTLIVEEVTKAGITLTHLREELIDHICCVIEDDLRKGLTFDEAFQKTKATVGLHELQKVQENTLLHIDKNYRIMKNTMKIVGLASMIIITIGALFKIQHWPGAGVFLLLGFTLLGAVFVPTALWTLRKESKLKINNGLATVSSLGSILFIFGVLFKLMHWPGAGIMLLVGFSILALVLLPTALATSIKNETSRQMRSTYIVGTIAMGIYLIGDLFKLMHWPGAAILILTGTFLLTTLFLPMYGLKTYKLTKTITPNFLFVSIGILFFTMFSLLLAVKTSVNAFSAAEIPIKTVAKSTEITENLSRLQYNKLLKSISGKDSVSVVQLQTNANKINAFIENLKLEIVSLSQNNNETTAIALLKNPELIQDKSNSQIPSNVLMQIDKASNRSNASLLATMILALQKNILLIHEGNLPQGFLQNNLLFRAPVTADTDIEEEILKEFNNLNTMGAITKLCVWQNNLRMAELTVIENVKSPLEKQTHKQ